MGLLAECIKNIIMHRDYDEKQMQDDLEFFKGKGKITQEEYDTLMKLMEEYPSK